MIQITLILKTGEKVTVIPQAARILEQTRQVARWVKSEIILNRTTR